MKFYTYRRSESARARIVQTRDARTVNPDENKSDPRKAISGPISVAFRTVYPRWNAARVNSRVASYTQEITPWLFTWKYARSLH